MGKKTTKINPWDNSSKGAAVAWSPPQRKKNPVLDSAEKLLTNPKNKAPAAKFIQRQKKLKNLLDEM